MSVKHRTYFDGSVQSLELLTAKGRATVGVIEPGTFQFEAEDEEHIHVVAGTLRATSRLTRTTQLILLFTGSRKFIALFSPSGPTRTVCVRGVHSQAIPSFGRGADG